MPKSGFGAPNSAENDESKPAAGNLPAFEQVNIVNWRPKSAAVVKKVSKDAYNGQNSGENG